MTTTTQLPPHQRMHEVSVRHLINVLQNLQQMKGQPGFDPFRNEQTKHKSGLIQYLTSNYTSAEIDAAWSQATQNYPQTNYKGRSRGHGQGQGGIPNGGTPTGQGSAGQGQQAQGQGGGQAQGQQAQGQGGGQAQGQQGQGSAGQGQGTGNYPRRPSETQNPIMQPLVDQIWPLIHPKVYDTAKEGDTALQQAITAALKNVAAQGGTAGGTVTIQTAVTLQTPTMAAPKSLGIQHRNFPRLLKAANARMRSGQRLNIWLYGPPGTGKTTAGERLAEVLELKFFSNSALATQYELLGFTAAGGGVIRTQFREAWEHGGVWLGDEIDASSPAAILALNAALANGFCAFPDGIVRRHPDCVVIAGANTTGQGATTQFVGRNKLDSTTLDRFVFVDWPLDEGLEASLCADQRWVAHVRKIRGNAEKRKVLGHAITPRATLFGEALLAAGLEWAEVEEMTLRKGASQETWGAIQ